jgi:hypothetical protein
MFLKNFEFLNFKLLFYVFFYFDKQMIENKKYFNVFLSKKYLTFTTFLNNNLRASGREELKKNTIFYFFGFHPFLL